MLQGITPEAGSSGWSAGHSWGRPTGVLEQIWDELEAPGHWPGETVPSNQHRGLSTVLRPPGPSPPHLSRTFGSMVAKDC